MTRRVVWDPRSRADLRAIRRNDRHQADRITLAVESFAELGQGDIRKLQGRTDEFRLRVGDWRVLFTLADGGHIMAISRVLNRRDAYRG
jgi:mRNA interferase RelE/StbE